MPGDTVGWRENAYAHLGEIVEHRVRQSALPVEVTGKQGEGEEGHSPAMAGDGLGAWDVALGPSCTEKGL